MCPYLFHSVTKQAALAGEGFRSRIYIHAPFPVFFSDATFSSCLSSPACCFYLFYYFIYFIILFIYFSRSTPRPPRVADAHEDLRRCIER